jgi:O-antigen ligase
MILPALLFYAVLVLWVEERWAWATFQVGIFLLAGIRILRSDRYPPAAPSTLLASAAAWPFLQLAAGTSVSPGQTWYATLDWLTFALVFALASVYPPKRFLRCASWFGMLLAAAAVLQQCSAGGRIFWIFPSGYSDHVLGPFVNRNQYAAWIELLIPPAIYLAFSDRRLRWLYATAALIMFGSVLAGGSRAGAALAIAEVLTTLILLAGSQTKPFQRVWVAASQFLALAAITAGIARWQNPDAGMHRNGMEALRIDAVKASLQMIREHPWMGWGLGSWQEVYPRYAGFDTGLYVNQAHNDWAQWASEGGLPFLALMAIFAWLLSKRAWRSIYGVGTLAFLLHALVDYPMQQRPAVAAWFFAMAGVVFQNRQREATKDGLLRRIRRLAHSLSPRDPGRIQKTGPAGSPGPL